MSPPPVGSDAEVPFKGSLAPVIAHNVKGHRTAAGISQEQLALRLQERGLGWGRNQVAWLETGNRDPTVTEFLFLAAALGVRPAQLLKIPEDMLTPRAATAADEEGRYSIGHAEVPAEVVPGLLLGRGFKYLTAAWELSTTAAETAAAGKLGLTAKQVQDLGFHLWGQILDHVRDERAGHPTGPGAAMKKAHVTRKLMDELKAEAWKRGWLHDDGDQDTKSGTTKARKEKRT